MVILPVGERWLLLSLFAALGRPVLALAVLLVLGVFALVYMAAGRIGRALAWSPAVTGDHVVRDGLAALVDAGPLLALAVPPLARPRGRWGWLLPPLALAVELGAVLVTVQVVAPGSMPWGYLAAAALAFRGYDLATRQRLLGDGRSALFAGLALGVGLRTVLVPVAALLLGGGRISIVLAALAGWVLVVTVVESAAAWRAAAEEGRST